MAIRKRTRIWLVGAVAAVVLVAGGGYALFAWQAGGGPPPVSLSSESPSGDPTAPAGSLDGAWAVATDSFVGYRVREKLGFLPAPSDAVGRTTAVTGSLTISGLNVTGVDVTADLTQLASDRSLRDERMHTIGLESDRFPQAGFQLDAPIAFDSKPASGQTVETTATGTLTLHGVTKDVSLPIQARWTADRIEVIGSLDIQFADYDITPPNIGGFVTVQDHGTMEFQLFFTP